MDIKGWNEEVSPRMSIQLFDIDSLIEMLKSEIDIFQFIENHTIIEDRIITKF